jgi:hypothetical protein
MVRGRGKTSVRGGRRKDEVLMGGGMDGGRSVRFEGKPGAELRWKYLAKTGDLRHVLALPFLD